jgi:hypothetical protein
VLDPASPNMVSSAVQICIHESRRRHSRHLQLEHVALHGDSEAIAGFLGLLHLWATTPFQDSG